MTAIPTGQVDRRLAGAPVTLTLEPIDESTGEHYAIEDATATVYDGAGVAVTEDLDVAISDGEGEGDTANVMTLTVDADDLPFLDIYRVDWNAIVDVDVNLSWSSTLEICGGYAFTVASFRAMRPEFASWSAERVMGLRRLAEQRIEAGANVAIVPRGARETLRGDGKRILFLEHVALREVYSITIDGVALSETELAALTLHEAGMVERPSGCVWTPGSTITVHYAHGYDGVDEPTADAARRLAREFALPSAMPERAVLQATDVGTFRLSLAGRDGYTGIPNVDAVIESLSRRRPVTG